MERPGPRRRNRRRLAALLLLLLPAASPAVAFAGEAASGARAGATESRAAPPLETGAAFDPQAATRAYLDRLSPEEKARSDAYYEGGYWLLLVGFLWELAVAWLLLGGRLSARMRDLAERLSPAKALVPAFYGVQWILLTGVLFFPLTFYRGFLREHSYGLSTQTLGAWLTDQAKALGLGAILWSLMLVVLYAALRRFPRTWWIWGSGVALAFFAAAMVVAPVFITPLFYTYTPLEDEAIREPVMRLARANGVPVEDIYVIDASRRTQRIGARISGFLGTERIALYDTLLARASPDEVEVVAAHEIGHYVLNHIGEWMMWASVVLFLGFAFLSRAFEAARRRWGERWGIRGIADVAGLPLLEVLLAAFFFIATPVTNTIVRTNEIEADLFALNASGKPDAFAEIALKLGEYRKLEPSPLEELIFFEHPSGRTRILAAMRYKAEHPETGR